MECHLDTKIIFENIKNRILNKMTRAELSRKLKITPQTLNTILKNMEVGKDCRISTLKKIAAAGEIKCEELLIKN